MYEAKFVNSIIVTDPDVNGSVELSVFKHIQSGGMFAIDSSFIDQTFDDEQDVIIADPLNIGRKLKLTGI